LISARIRARAHPIIRAYEATCDRVACSRAPRHADVFVIVRIQTDQYLIGYQVISDVLDNAVTDVTHFFCLEHLVPAVRLTHGHVVGIFEGDTAVPMIDDLAVSVAAHHITVTIHWVASKVALLLVVEILVSICVILVLIVHLAVAALRHARIEGVTEIPQVLSTVGTSVSAHVVAVVTLFSLVNI
jgi:hypothetical protein